MFQYKCLNPISQTGLGLFGDEYKQTEELKDEIKAEEVSQEENYDLLQAFQMLDGEERMILSCSILEGYSSEEIGHMLAMNPSTVRSKKSRALEKLRKNLA